MANDVDNKQILPFFYNNNIESNNSAIFKEFEVDGYKVFAYASLYSAKIDGLSEHLKFGIDSLISGFSSDKSEILERMKNSIFTSGDKLADHLLDLKLPIDDVDYNVCLLAFRDGIVYVWIDGNLNLRIYRGSESLLVNDKSNPQFFGSATVETGDILAVSSNEYLKNHDSHIEDYVLEKSEPSYPVFLVDYQVEHVYQKASESIVYQYKLNEEVNTQEYNEIETDNISFLRRRKDQISEKLASINIKEKFSSLKDNASRLKEKLNESGILPKTKDFVLKGLKAIWSVLMGITSAILDFIFGIVYNKSIHKFRRFQTSNKKKNLQYFMIVLTLISLSYFLFFNSWNTTNTNIASNNSDTKINNDAKIKAELQSQYNTLSGYVNPPQINSFNSANASLKNEILKARNAGFSDTGFLDRLLKDTEDLEYKIYKITAVEKVDEVFSLDQIENAQLADFSLIGNTVYAIDRANSQVLVSNSATQKFDVFAADKTLVSMNYISCLQTSCYIIDEDLGIVILNLQTKAFSKFSALKDAGRGVKELATFQSGSNSYIYTLIPQQGKLLRYTRLGEGLSQPEVWTNVPGFGLNVTDILVDGGIYEMSNDGTLRRFFNRNVEPATTFAGLGTALLPLSGDLQIAATAPRDPAPGVVNRFYVADSTNQRIAVYDRDLDTTKKLTFLGSFKYRGTEKINFGSFKEITLSPDEKSIYALSNNIVFRFSITSI